MITAEDARKLSKIPTAKDYVESLNNIIESIAKQGGNSVDVDGIFWSNAGYYQTQDYKEATYILRKLGYYVEFINENGIHGKHYTRISW